ncbi:MAG: alpha/beta fold hydrolase [Streptomyces sp.]|jgi:pimeloyl-ACP methyl ester carboxylesterase|uniref:alpha/beta hydrolase n=1 Tax=Streptomyces sp. TaxID=1931 RepID=UPI0025E42A4A|nr:alpha/beta hydrolase [Streptomyces sp.]MBW8801046.1 alpha/beta fold hydrolase [Streptomyces sp.]
MLRAERALSFWGLPSPLPTWLWPTTYIDHEVPHTSNVPANNQEAVKLFVRERRSRRTGPVGKPVLMLHGRSAPVLASFDLQYKTYSWAEALAKDGYDVFMMDLQGSGRSPRPEMGSPCNLSENDQKLLIPRPPGFTPPCSPTYPHQLNNSDSDQAELHRVVEYIKLKCGVEQVAFVGWSAAAFTMGPYAVKHPENVESMFLLAPIFPPKATSSPPSPPPSPVPMSLGARPGLENAWNLELRSPDQREPGMVDAVWAAYMESEPIGSTWGPPEGLNRIRSFARWGWNETTAGQGGVLGGSVPVLIVDGEHDRTANTTPPSGNVELNFSVRALYGAIAGPHKVMVKALGASHQMPWEQQHMNLHNLSSKWIEDRQVDGKTTGVFVMHQNGVISPAP